MAATTGTFFQRLERPPLPSSYASSNSKSCPKCSTLLPTPLPAAPAFSSSEESQRRITDLEAQVKLLNSKAAAAVDKLADYEDEVRFLRAVHARSQETGTNITPGQRVNTIANNPAGGSSPPPPASSENAPPPQPVTSRLSSFSAFLPGRRSPATQNITSFSPNGQQQSIPPVPSLPFPGQQARAFSTGHNNASVPNLNQLSSPSTIDPSTSQDHLTTLLQAERTARQSAERSLSAAHSELEELTAQLFGQANEMVATERKARAKLEERVKVLEKRDGEKRRRLERLERALERIERVREMVG